MIIIAIYVEKPPAGEAAPRRCRREPGACASLCFAVRYVRRLCLCFSCHGLKEKEKTTLIICFFFNDFY